MMRVVRLRETLVGLRSITMLLKSASLHKTTCDSLSVCSLRGYCSAWQSPQGHNTGIQIYNSSTRTKCPLILPQKNIIYWYVCGPTVYDDPHIGHASMYVRCDIIRRILTNFFNLNVIYMMNITDIDDKIIQKSRQLEQHFSHVSKLYEARFLQAMTRLNVAPPTVIHRVTENITHIIKYIEKLLDSGSAYVTTQGNVYFKCSTSSEYGSLSHQVSSPLEEQVSTIDEDKLDVRDFALWKVYDGDMPTWESPWGRGRPGWHIGCSTLASRVFGDRIDIHSGGRDLLFPHHENELAQSRCYHSTDQWVNYWLHTGLLRMKNDVSKMSKSLKNTFSISSLLEQYNANQFRIYCLLAHYRNDMEFDDDAMSQAVQIYKKLISLRSLAYSYITNPDGQRSLDNNLLMQSLIITEKRVQMALGDDFDTGTALRAVINLVHVTNIELCKRPSTSSPSSNQSDLQCCSGTLAAVINYIENFMYRLGVNLSSQATQGDADSQGHQLDQVIKCTVAFRENVRNFALGGVSAPQSSEEKLRLKEHRKANSSLITYCDQVRDELQTLANVKIKDSNEGRSIWEMDED